MEKSKYQRHQHGGSSPRLLRSKSGSTAATPSSLPQASTIFSRNEAKKRKKEAAASAAHGGGYVRFLPRSMSKAEVPRRTRSASTSPSAWALSPGRSLSCSSPAPPTPVAKSPAGSEKLMKPREERSGMSGVFKYFRQKKVSPLLEEEYHQFRLAYNRLLQWRFANARAGTSMTAVKRAAQVKLLNGWVRISVMRKIIVEKKSEIEKVKREKKLHHILSSEMGMLNEWWRIEAKNVEAVGRLLRKLSAISLCLPLLHNAQADIMSVYDATTTATEVMDAINPIIMGMYCQ
ncbi:hypothetical protein C2S51_014420, partial [Perilla frutescens var. frutescens]